jgi:sulfur carrier protein ThiS
MKTITITNTSGSVNVIEAGDDIVTLNDLIQAHDIPTGGVTFVVNGVVSETTTELAHDDIIVIVQKQTAAR